MRTNPRPALVALAAALAVVLPACGKNNNPASSDTGSTNAARTTEEFTGTLTPHTSAWHTFSVTQSGTVDATLTAVSPTMTLGLGIGTTPTNGCSVQAWNNAATTGTVLSGSIVAGSFCVTVYDVGNVADSVSYTVTVTHP